VDAAEVAAGIVEAVPVAVDVARVAEAAAIAAPRWWRRRSRQPLKLDS